MNINPKTLLFSDLTPQERAEMRAWAEAVILRGELPRPTPEWVVAWIDACGFTSQQALLLISSVLPQRVLLSLVPSTDLCSEEVEKTVTLYASRLHSDAGQGGYNHDGGASDLMTILAAWRAGLRGEMPPQILKVLEEPSNPRWPTGEPAPPMFMKEEDWQANRGAPR